LGVSDWTPEGTGEASVRISVDRFRPFSSSMPSTRFEASSIKNKVKRQEIARKLKREKGKKKLQSRLAIAKAEIADPTAKKVRLPSPR